MYNYIYKIGISKSSLRYTLYITNYCIFYLDWLIKSWKWFLKLKKYFKSASMLNVVNSVLKQELIKPTLYTYYTSLYTAWENGIKLKKLGSKNSPHASQ